jgi:SlyX protein
MNDGQDLSERIDALESRIMYQDDTIEVLNQTITAQWREIDALKRQITSLSERLDEARAAGAQGPVDESPPHY